MVMGLSKSIAVFYNPELDNIEVLKFENNLTTIFCENKSDLIELRKLKQKTNWIQKSHVPFEVKNENLGQLTLSDEENNSVLELRFYNETDKNYDILYLYFKNSIANFKLSNLNEAMSVSIKEVIQNLLYNQIQIIIDERSSRNATF